MPSTTGKRSAISPVRTPTTAFASAARAGGTSTWKSRTSTPVPSSSTRERSARPLHGLDGRERAEGRVAVVLRAAAVEAIAASDGRPGPEALAPPDHLRLLVAVTVEQDDLRRGPRHLHQDHGRAAGKPH